VVFIVVKRGCGKLPLSSIMCNKNKESPKYKAKTHRFFGGFDGGVKWARTIDLYDVNVTL
jgi:hypothetical protein